MLNEQELALDIAQEVFTDLYEYKGKEISSIKSWLYRVTANKCVDYFKQIKKQREQIQEQTEYSEIPEPDKISKSKIVQDAISRLKENDRILLALYSENMSYKEISEVTGIKFSSVGKTLSRALNKLEKELKPKYHELFAG